MSDEDREPCPACCGAGGYPVTRTACVPGGKEGDYYDVPFTDLEPCEVCGGSGKAPVFVVEVPIPAALVRRHTDLEERVRADILAAFAERERAIVTGVDLAAGPDVSAVTRYPSLFGYPMRRAGTVVVDVAPVTDDPWIRASRAAENLAHAFGVLAEAASGTAPALEDLLARLVKVRRKIRFYKRYRRRGRARARRESGRR